MSKAKAQRRRSAGGELASVKRQRDGLLDVLASILYAYGNGDDYRLPVSNAYVGRPRRPIVVNTIADRLVVRFEEQKEDHDAP